MHLNTTFLLPIFAFPLAMAACGSDPEPESDGGAIDASSDGTVVADGGADADGTDAATDAEVDAPIQPDGGTEPWTCRGVVHQVPGGAGDMTAAIQSAFDGAVAGDCVVIAAGEHILEGSVLVDKAVSLLGHGPQDGGTWLRRPEGASDDDVSSTMFRFEVDSREPSGLLIAGLRVSGLEPSRRDGDGLSIKEDVGIEIRGAVDFVVTACRIEHFGFAGLEIKHDDDLSRGLIFGNEFRRNVKGENGLGLGYGVVLYGSNEAWLEDPEFGTANFIFIEDNYFFEHRHALAGGGAARYVVRHNEIVDNLWGHAIDGHEGRGGGLGTSNHFSTRAVEAYNNELRNDRFQDLTPIEPGHDLNDIGTWAMGFRGGEAVVFGNRIEGYLSKLLIVAFHDDDDVYPIPYQIGDQSAVLGVDHSGIGPAERAGDFFEWDNTFVPYREGDPTNREYFFPGVSPYAGGDGTDEFLREGRDYHLNVMRPDYTPFVYPHPERIEWTGPPAE